MKRIVCVLLICLLSLSIIPALAGSEAAFPWRSYTLEVVQATADMEAVGYNDVPEGGIMIYVRLEPLSGKILVEDIASGVNDEILLRTADGETYSDHAIRGIPLVFNLQTGSIDVGEEAEYIGIFYFLEGRETDALDGAVLIISTENGEEDIIIHLDGIPRELSDSGT